MRKKHIGKLGQQLKELSRGSLTKGCQSTGMGIVSQVKHVMLIRGMTQVELAERLNVHPSTISRWLNNPENMTVNALYRLCNAVGLAPSLHTETFSWVVDSHLWVNICPQTMQGVQDENFLVIAA